MIWLRNKKIKFSLHTLNLSPGDSGMRGFRKFCQRSPTLTFFVLFCFYVLLTKVLAGIYLSIHVHL